MVRYSPSIHIDTLCRLEINKIYTDSFPLLFSSYFNRELCSSFQRVQVNLASVKAIGHCNIFSLEFKFVFDREFLKQSSPRNVFVPVHPLYCFFFSLGLRPFFIPVLTLLFFTLFLELYQMRMSLHGLAGIIKYFFYYASFWCSDDVLKK